ncbi:MAG: UDP-N-acetylenolpyruvoylglucosamine reductase [Nitrospirae bacterium RBG_13_39_12]|nr:MAG: UDP-N-acetylenolpyruvoylglucosamine reductase [Nitrospirae bacterium RBG_13_39_12]
MNNQVKDGKTREIFSESLFKGEVRFMEQMSLHTSLRIGGPADVFAVPEDILSLRNMHASLKRNQIPCLPLGGGTNILVRDGGIEGVVISFKSFKKIEILSEDDNYVNLSVEAGTPLQRLVRFSAENGFAGIEGLAGIPGSFGGAVCGNAGAFGYEIKDVLVSLAILDYESNIKNYKAEGIDFGYRKSGILPGEILISAEITLKKDRKDNVLARIEGFLSKKREKQPVWEPSAGCVFKNPPGLSAGKLIDEAGCKGMRIDGVEVSSIHANFFVNKGKATAFDFIRLMEEVAHKVREKFGILLEPEIRIVGRESVN